MGEEPTFPPTGMVAARPEHLQRVATYGIRRAEIVQFHCAENELRRVMADGWPLFSAHAPLVYPESFPEWPLAASLVDFDAERRERGLRLMERSIDLAADLGASYVVVHLQRTVRLLDERVPPGARTSDALDLAIDGARRLAHRAQRRDIPVHLENMIAHPLLCRPEHYAALLEAVQEVGLCLDVGHLWIDAMKFGFDPIEFASRLAPQIRSLHIYANRVTNDFEFNEMRERGLLRKFPVHPDQSPASGWIDVPAVIEPVLSVNPSCHVTHEVYRSLDTDHARTAEGLRWIEDVCRKARRCCGKRRRARDAWPRPA